MLKSNSIVNLMFNHTGNEDAQGRTPCTIASLCSQTIQLRDGLASANARTCCNHKGTESSDSRVQLALEAIEKALSILQEVEQSHACSQRKMKQKDRHREPLTVFERANIFQSWSECREQRSQDSQQQRTASKRKAGEWQNGCQRTVLWIISRVCYCITTAVFTVSVNFVFSLIFRPGIMLYLPSLPKRSTAR